MPESASKGSLYLVDSHCHLQDGRFARDREQVLRQARQGGVRFMVVPGNDLASSRAAVELAGKEDDVYATVGVHPHDARGITPSSWKNLQQLLTRKKVVAVGETGLDYHYDNSPRDVQREAFRRHVDMAREAGLPLVVHSREADEDTITVLQEMCADEVGGVLHCFSGDEDMARRGMDLGFYISLAGPVTFPRARPLHQVAARVPLEAMLVETDAPYLAPVPRRGQRNEPALVRLVVEAIARIKGLEAEQAARVTAANACRLFGLRRNRETV